jgi:hypothetical protein
MTDTPEPDLAHLVDRLTREHVVEITEAGTTTAVRRPPLLRDLAQARTASLGVGRGSGQQLHARMSLNAEASELLTAIERRLRAWASRAGIRPIGNGWPPPEQILTAWHDTADPDHITPARIRTLAGWIQQIEDLIDPPRRYTLAAACPLCAAAYVDTVDQHGRALAVTEREPADRSIVTCRACDHVWNGLDGARQLADLINGRQQQTA